MRRIIKTKVAIICTIIHLAVFIGTASAGDFNPLFFPNIGPPQKVSQTPFLGIRMGTVPDNDLSETVKKESAAYIDDVIPGTAADEAGIVAGDIIVAVDGEPLNDKKVEPRDQLKKAITGKNIGDNLSLSIIRKGKEMTINAKLGEYKKIPARVKTHPEIDNFQKSMDETNSALYRTMQASGRLDDFLNTMAQLKEQSLLVDSYKIAPDNPFRLSEINYLLQNPTNIIPVSREITGSILNHLDAGSYDLGSLIKEASARLDVEFSLNTAEPPAMDRAESLNDVIKHIIKVITLAESYRKMAFKELSGEEMKFLEEEALGFSSNDEASPQTQERLFKIAAKIDYQMLYRSIAEASGIVSPQIIQILKKIEFKDLERHADIPFDLVSGDVIDNIETQFGKIIIGGPGKTHYKGNVFMIIDFAGDDLYENNAGASTPGNPFRIVIDLAGDDKYIAKGNLSQGTGFMGTGILADIQGDDLYIGERGSQGVGIFGGGILLDTDGDDMFIADSHTEGAGLFGIGMLIDMNGNDTYKAHRSSQGYSFVKGFGVLVDLKGDDLYLAAGKYPDHRDPEHATQSLSQGFSIGIRPDKSPVGASGGIGLLIDKEGNDKYVGDYFSQGASYWYALGILHDMNGDDMYIAGRYAQGAGIHTSAGSLIDENGDDSYIVTYGVSQGVGHDSGIGVLADFYGNNTYKSGVLSQGAATCGGIGILYDKEGKDPSFTHNGSGDVRTEDESCTVQGFGILMNGMTDKTAR